MKMSKKFVAFFLALAMLISLCPTTQTYAATKKPTLSAKKVTLQVGSKKTLKVKNTDKSAKMKWSSTKKSIATVTSKGVVKAVKAGSAKIVCNVTLKNKKQYKLVCNVVVKKATPKSVSKTVKTQEELLQALKTSNVTKITIKTEAETEFVIPEGKYNKIALVVDAPNADVVNNGIFKSIDIKSIKPNTWKEKASGNSIKITAVDARIVVEQGASLAKVSVTQEGGKIKIEATGTIDSIEIDAPVIVDLNVDGKIGEVAVKAAAVVSVEGNTSEVVPITVAEEAKGADVSSSTPVEVNSKADISLTLEKGAEGSTVKSSGEKTQIAVKNDSAEAIKIETPGGVQEVTTGTSSKVNADGTKSETTTTNPGYIYTSPDPLKVSSAMIRSSQKIAVYFNQTVPADITAEQIRVTGPNGKVQAIGDVKRHSGDTNSYWIEFAEAMSEEGTYSVELTVSGTEFTTSFTYDPSVWKALDAAYAIVNAEFDKTHVASKSGLKSPELCRRAFEGELMTEIAKNSEAKSVNISVQTRPFKYEEYFPGETLAENHVMVSIWVGMFKGNANYMDNRFVEFECTGPEVTVTKPEVVGKTTNSIVVKAVDGQQYACVKEDEDIKGENVQWYSSDYIDILGNIEIGGLEADATYKVYAKIEGLDPVEADSMVSLADAVEVFVLFIQNSTIDGTIYYDSEDKMLLLKVPFTTCVYGSDEWNVEVKSNNPAKIALYDWNDGYLRFFGDFAREDSESSFTFMITMGENVVASQDYTVRYTVTDDDLAQVQN